MLESSAQICEEVRSFAMRSLETKLSVVPGRKCDGHSMDDWEDIANSSLDRGF